MGEAEIMYTDTNLRVAGAATGEGRRSKYGKWHSQVPLVVKPLVWILQQRSSPETHATPQLESVSHLLGRRVAEQEDVVVDAGFLAWAHDDDRRHTGHVKVVEGLASAGAVLDTQD